MMKTVLESESVRLAFENGRLTALTNHLTGQVYAFCETGPCFETAPAFGDSGTLSDPIIETRPDEYICRYRSAEADWEVVWRLLPGWHFAEKTVTWIPRKDCSLLHVSVAEFSISGPAAEVVCVKHPTFARIEHPGLKREPGTEPVKTYFMRTPVGGIFLGLEMPFDKSHAQPESVHLQFAPNLQLKAGFRFMCEAAYVGVYRRSACDLRADAWRASDDLPPSPDLPLPLPSESVAMTAMTSALLGPSRHGVKVFACGWHSEMEQATYTSDSLAGELRSLEFLKSCGLDGLTDSHPWGGETDKMNALVEGDGYAPGTEVRTFLEYARQLGLAVTQWPTMNQTHPWNEKGRPFRPDRPEWARGVSGKQLGGINADNFRDRAANCLACMPFYHWIEGVICQAMDTGYYQSWCMDGDFWGTGAYYHTTVPVTCQADHHEHRAGDSNYACQQALNKLIATIRESYPKTYIVMCRPPMDLGVWSNRQVDACFTLIETGTGASNIVAGNEIRTTSRIRVHHHFFPHWMDWALLFPSYAGYGSYVQYPAKRPPWPSEHLDYILLSALSSTPNLLMYLPTKTGIPEADKDEIRKWLDWARRNERFLMHRKDLFDWPGPDRVDGSIHWVDDEGLFFFFNASIAPRTVTIDPDCFPPDIPSDRWYLHQEYPLVPALNCMIRRGESLTWNVPPQSVIMIRTRGHEYDFST